MSRDTFVTESGERVSTAGGEAERLVGEGAELVSGSALRVVDTQTGQVGEVSPEDFRRNQERFRLQTAEEAEQSRLQEQFGDRGAETAITSALDTVLLGGVSDRMRDAGVQGELQGLREFNEGAALAGDVAGAVGLGSLASLPFAGLRAAGIAGRIASGVGEGALGAGLETVALQNREAALGNPAQTAEEILGQVGISTLLGGALGGVAEGVFAGAGSLGRSLMRGGRRGAAATRDALGRIVERTTGREAAPGVADALLDTIARRGTTGLGADDADFVRRGLSLTEEGAAIRRAVDAGEGAVDEVLSPMRRQIDELMQTTEATAEFAKGQLKRGSIRRVVDEGALARAADDIPEMVGSIRRLADEVAGEAALPGARALSKRLAEIVDEVEPALAQAAATGGRDGATDAFIALDKMKRKLGYQVARVKRSQGAGFLGPQFEQAYELSRQALERSDVWGKAADLQRSINGTWSDYIANSSKFRRSFLTDAGQNEGFDRLLTADPKKLQAWLKKTGTAVSELDDEVFQRFSRTSAELNEVMAKHLDMDDATRANAMSARKAAEALREQYQSVSKSLGAANQFQSAAEQLGARDDIFGALLDPRALATAGGFVGLSQDSGGAGAAAGLGVGAVLSAFRRPDRLLRMMAAMERMRGTFTSRVEQSTERLVEAMAKPETRRRVFAGTIGALSAVAVAERFDEGVGTLKQVRDPQDFAQALADRTESVAAVAPDSAAQMVATAARAAQYLQSILPPTAFAPEGTLGGPERRPSERVPEYQQRQYLEAAQVVDDPLSVLDEAERGTLSRTHVETLRNVYPNLHQQIVTRTVERVADREQALPYEGRLALSMLVDTPTDPSLTGDYVLRAQGAVSGAAAPSPQQNEPAVTPGNASPPEVSGMHASGMQQLVARRG